MHVALNLARLRLLHEFQRVGNVAEVADIMGCTPSAVSQQLHQLERDAGAKLLRKQGRQVVLTPAGETLARYATQIVDLQEQALSAVARSDQVRGTLRVATFQTVLVTLIPEVVHRLRQRYPLVDVQCTQREVTQGIESLRRREVDLCIGEQFPGEAPIGGSDIHRHDVHAEPLLLVRPSEGPLRDRQGIADMADVPWVIDPRDSAAGQYTWRLCHAAGFEPKVFIESPDPLLAAHIVGQGHAIAVLPQLIAQHFPKTVTYQPLPGNPARVLFTATRVGTQDHPAVTAFQAVLEEVLAERVVGAVEIGLDARVDRQK